MKKCTEIVFIEMQITYTEIVFIEMQKTCHFFSHFSEHLGIVQKKVII